MAHPTNHVRTGDSFHDFYRERDQNHGPRGLSPARAQAAVSGHSRLDPRERTYSSSSSSSYPNPGRFFSTSADGKARGQHNALDKSIIAMRENLAEEKGWAGWERLCERNFDKFGITNCTNAIYSAAVYVRDEDKPRFLRRYDAIITRLLKRIQDHIENDDPETIEAQTLSNTIYGLAKFNKIDNELIRAISKRAQTKIDDMHEQGCSNIAWAFTSFGNRDLNLFKAISGRAQTLIQGFIGQELSSLAMSFAKMEIPDPLLFKAISDRTKQIVDSFDHQGLANMAYAYGKAKIDDDNPVREIFKEMQRRRFPQLPWQTITQVLSTIEKLKCIEDRDFILYLADQLLKIKKDVDVGILTCACRSLAVIFNLYEQRGHRPSAKELEMLDELLSEIDERLYHLFLRKEDISSHSKTQINQTLLYLEHFQPEFYRPQNYGRVKLVADEYTYLSENGFERPASSWKHKDIHERIERLVGHELSMEQFHSGYFLDTILDENNKIALEVVGPYHFLSSGGQPGEEILRDRILKKMGWTFVEVPITTWQDIPDEGRDQYLMDKLPKHLLPAEKKQDSSLKT